MTDVICTIYVHNGTNRFKITAANLVQDISDDNHIKGLNVLHRK
jgi:hypothetical protein